MSRGGSSRPKTGTHAEVHQGRYLNVPFLEKDEASALGARFDAAKKLWYVPYGVGLAAFEKWVPAGKRENETTIASLTFPSFGGSKAVEITLQGDTTALITVAKHRDPSGSGARKKTEAVEISVDAVELRAVIAGMVAALNQLEAGTPSGAIPDIVVYSRNAK